MVPTNTAMFLGGLKPCRESRTYQVLLVSKKKIGGNHAFFRDNKASIWKKKITYIALFFTAFLNNCCFVISEKCVVTPQFSFWIPIALAKIRFFQIVINYTKN